MQERRHTPCTGSFLSFQPVCALCLQHKETILKQNHYSPLKAGCISFLYHLIGSGVMPLQNAIISECRRQVIFRRACRCQPCSSPGVCTAPAAPWSGLAQARACGLWSASGGSTELCCCAVLLGWAVWKCCFPQSLHCDAEVITHMLRVMCFHRFLYPRYPPADMWISTGGVGFSLSDGHLKSRSSSQSTKGSDVQKDTV